MQNTSGSSRLAIKLLPNDLAIWAGVFIVFVLSINLFYLKNPQYGSDLQAHLQFSLELARGQRVIPHPGFHYSIIFLSTATGLSLEVASSILLAAATSASYCITYFVFKGLFRERYSVLFLASISLILAITSAIYAPFFNKNIYLGQGTPNIWHSPTWVMMHPFALLSFFLTERCLESPRWDCRPIVLASSVLVVCTIFKPSFALVFIPALSFYLFLAPGFKLAWNSYLMKTGLIVVPTLILMVFQYQIKYNPDKLQASSVIFAPFEVWGAKTPSIAFSAFLALAFPLSVVLLKPKSLIKHQGYLLVWLLVLVAFLQRLLLAESGPLKSHGNWAWGYFIALKIAFVYSMIVLLNDDGKKDGCHRFLDLIPWAMLILHGTSGLIYLCRLFSGKGFY